MSNVFTLTEAKSRFSEIINRIVYKKEKIMITKKGRKVAVVIPMEEFKQEREEGLIKAEGALAGLEDSIDEMVNLIYEAREKEMSREVNL